MRLKLIIDNMYHEIDSSNPELLGPWVMEILGRVDPNPGTLFQIHAQPSWIPDANSPNGFKADWITDSRYMDLRTHFDGTPRDLLARLSEVLDKYEKESFFRQ